MAGHRRGEQTTGGNHSGINALLNAGERRSRRRLDENAFGARE